MKTWIPLAAVVLMACGDDPAVTPPRDAATPLVDGETPDAPIADAGVEACTDIGASCLPLAESCAGGFRYGCYGGTCPSGDVGSCRVLSQNTTTTRYTETCCERAACTREALVAQECTELTDGGRKEGWSCPGGVKPAGKCIVNGVPQPAAGSPTEYCCQ